MIERLNYVAINGPAIASMAKAKQDITTIDPKLRAMLELRVSQINGCTYCVDLHVTEARHAGETQQRLDCLVVWHEGGLFEPREKAAFGWAEALMRVSDEGAPEALFNGLHNHFTEADIVDLTLIIAQMNAWNRLAIGFAHQPDARTG